MCKRPLPLSVALRSLLPALSIALVLGACGGGQKRSGGPRRQREVAPCHEPLKNELLPKLRALTHLECTLKDDASNDFCNLTMYPPDAIACLADLVDDQTLLPKSATLAMIPHAYKAGDAAVFLAVHLLEVQLQDVLPPEVEQRFGDGGMEVYFEVMSTEDGREAVRQGIMLAAARTRR